MCDNNFTNISKDKLLKIIDEESILLIEAKDALNLSITELNIDSLELINLSFILDKKFNLCIDFDKVNSNTTLNELLNFIVPSSD